MRYASIASLLGVGLALALAAPAQAQAHVDVGIHLPGPPRLVVVPQVPTVQYVPAAPGNLFSYGGQYWVFANNGWHVSRGHNGPWIAVAPQFVPRPLLLVPVRYYPVRPGHWQRWGHQHPPRWHNEWGREWASRRDWRDHDRHDDRRRGHGRGRGDDDDGRGRGRGHGRGRD